MRQIAIDLQMAGAPDDQVAAAWWDYERVCEYFEHMNDARR